MRIAFRKDPFGLMNSIWDDDFLGVLSDDTATNVWEEGNFVKVKMRIPGFNKNNTDIEVNDNVLCVSGKISKEEEEGGKDKKFFRKEIETRSFSRSVTLPSRVKAEEADAEFKDGYLLISLPKMGDEGSRKISIK